MTAEAGRSLERFFERWIYTSALPRVRYASSVEGQEVVVRFEQVGEVFDIPVTVTIQTSEGAHDELVTLTEGAAEARFPLSGTLRSVLINEDHGALGHFERR
jgi:hypothetical protein